MKTSNKIALGASTVTASVASFAAPLTSTDFGTLQADIIGTIGVAAAIGVAVMVVGLGWDVGMNLVRKFAKRGAK